MFCLNTYNFRQYLGLAVIFAVISLAGCGPSAGGGTEATVAQYDWTELTGYLKSEFSKSSLPSGTYATNIDGIPAFYEDVSVNYSSSESVYSQTNIQEPGVDEGDKVKTDGTYLYIAGDNAVHIVRAVPTDSKNITSTIDVDGDVESIYLNDNKLIILYRLDNGYGLSWSESYNCLMVGFSYCTPAGAQLGIKIMDVSDPTSPVWVKEWVLDGWMASSRLVNEKLHIVQKFLPVLPKLQIFYDGTEEARDAAIAANEAALEDIEISELIPYYDTLDENGNITGSDPLITPENFYYPEESNGGTILSIVTFDLDNLSGSFQSAGLIADTHSVYSSTGALYAASTQYNYESAGTDQTIEHYKTFIYKFDLTGNKPVLKGSGIVNGKILNQFSMGEYNDVLRIATTSETYTSGEPGTAKSNNIYCLEESGEILEIIGSIEGIAPGEDIYSARFIGPRGFLVTFVKVDPLFTLDLSDPTNPTVAGELHVPGYSEYIHPLGDDYLITIGKNTITEEEYGWVYYQGIQLSIFDVTDFSSPELLHTEIIGDRGSESLALEDHRAFTFMRQNGLLAIPVKLYEYPEEPQYWSSQGDFAFEGLYVYRVTAETGFEHLGSISTRDTASSSYFGSWLRGVFIDYSVYAVNKDTVRSSEVDDIGGAVYSLSLSGED